MVHELCESCFDQVHASRFRAVVRAVEGITLSQRLSVTTVGRARPGSQKARHGIKAVDRLLSNAKLQREQRVWWTALARRLVNAERRMLVLLDWTQLHGGMWALVAAVPFRGRSLPLLAQSYAEAEVGSRERHEEFLWKLRQILPERCQPVIVADGGFRSPFFIACESLGMRYVVRLRNERGVLEHEDGSRISFALAFARATPAAKCLGDGRPYASSSHARQIRVVLGPRPKRRRWRRSDKDYQRKRAAEPWLLATNLENESAQSIVQIYAQRMQIEECFRDAKCPRFGWALKFALTKSHTRMNVLLLLASIAFACIALLGAAAVELGWEKSLRASSLRRPVLSVFTVGNLVAKSRSLRQIRLQSALKQLKALRAYSRASFPKITPPRSQNRNVSLPLPHGLFCMDCGWRGAEFGWPP
jgi:hypothetical protein